MTSTAISFVIAALALVPAALGLPGQLVAHRHHSHVKPHPRLHNWPRKVDDSDLKHQPRMSASQLFRSYQQPRYCSALVEDGRDDLLSCGTHSIGPGDKFVIESPTSFGGKYPPNYKCRYSIKASCGANIHFSCYRFGLEESKKCKYDWLSVNGNKYCGLEQPPDYFVDSLNIVFSSDYSMQDKGFGCSVVAISNTTLWPTPTPPSAVKPDLCTCGKNDIYAADEYSSSSNNIASRIYGGEPTHPHEYPWMARITNEDYPGTYCGGSVINDRYVLTAAHCTTSFYSNQIKVWLGDHEINVTNSRMAKVAEIIRHPQYSDATFDMDVALLRLAEPINLEKSWPQVAPVCLPPAGSFNGSYETGIVSGWGLLADGTTYASVLQSVSLNLLTAQECRNFEMPHHTMAMETDQITDNMMCAGGQQEGMDSCQADSGGPLIVADNHNRHQLIGVVSWGYECGELGTPGVYADVARAVNWIHQNTRDAVYCTATDIPNASLSEGSFGTDSSYGDLA